MIARIRLLFCLVFIVGSSTGCSGLFNTEPFVDIHTDKNGNQMLADTPRMWQDFVELTHRRIEREKNHAIAPGAVPWNEHWTSTIEAIQKNTQNAQKYTSYILNERRKAGLEELTIPVNNNAQI